MVHRPEPLPARLFDASQRTDPTFDKKHVPTAGAGSDGSQLHRGLLRFRQRTRPRHRRTDLQRTDRRDRKQPGIRPHPVVAPASRQLQNAPQNGDRSVAAPRRHGTAQHRPHAIGEISGRSRSRLLSIAATDRQRDLRAGLPQKTRATIQKKLAEDAAPAGIDAQHGRHLRPGDEHRRYPQSRPGHHARQDGRRTERQQPIPSARKLSDIFRSGGHIDFPCNFDGKNETGPRFQLRSHHDPEQNAVLRGPFRTVRRPQGAAFRPRYDDTGRGREKSGHAERFPAVDHPQPSGRRIRKGRQRPVPLPVLQQKSERLLQRGEGGQAG